MAYCSKCGNEKEYPYGKCPECGFQPPHPDNVRGQAYNDEGGFLWSLLGFCVPIIGLILYLIWKDEKPNTALAAGKGALAYVIFAAVLLVLYVVIFAGMFAVMA